MNKIFNVKQREKNISALFLHVQKTAGTSIVEMAAKHYGRADCISHGGYSGRQYEEFINTKFVSGHFGYDYVKALLPERYSFTFLRNPVERILSLYYFYRANDPETFPMYRIAHENGLADFLRLGLVDPLVKSRIWNNQVWQLACGWANPSNRRISSFSQDDLLSLAKEHLADFSHVGFTESFDHDMLIIAEALNMALPNKIVKSNSNSRPALGDIGVVERELLAELTCLDQNLYEYAKKQRIGAADCNGN